MSRNRLVYSPHGLFPLVSLPIRSVLPPKEKCTNYRSSACWSHYQSHFSSHLLGYRTLRSQCKWAIVVLRRATSVSQGIPGLHPDGYIVVPLFTPIDDHTHISGIQSKGEKPRIIRLSLPVHNASPVVLSQIEEAVCRQDILNKEHQKGRKTRTPSARKKCSATRQSDRR